MFCKFNQLTPWSQITRLCRTGVFPDSEQQVDPFGDGIFLAHPWQNWEWLPFGKQTNWGWIKHNKKW
jgi:hypothetical protein